MEIYFSADRDAFKTLLEQVQPGDCVRIPGFAGIAANSRELLQLTQKLFDAGAELISDHEAIDTRTAYGSAFRDICRHLTELDHSEAREKQRSGIEKAREAGKYRGRKPIAVDGELFEAVVALWRAGSISAREAMSRLDLKPNTFYRRIKEQEEQKMKDYKEAERSIRAEIREAAQQSRSDLHDLKKQVRQEARDAKEQLRSDARELKKAADEKLELHDVEKEMRKDRVRAENAHHDEVRQMKKDVENEARELKKLLENKD